MRNIPLALIVNLCSSSSSAPLVLVSCSCPYSHRTAPQRRAEPPPPRRIHRDNEAVISIWISSLLPIQAADRPVIPVVRSVLFVRSRFRCSSCHPKSRRIPTGNPSSVRTSSSSDRWGDRPTGRPDGAEPFCLPRVRTVAGPLRSSMSLGGPAEDSNLCQSTRRLRELHGCSCKGSTIAAQLPRRPPRFR